MANLDLVEQAADADDLAAISHDAIDLAAISHGVIKINSYISTYALMCIFNLFQ
jgi:hypothetical protein